MKLLEGKLVLNEEQVELKPLYEEKFEVEKITLSNKSDLIKKVLSMRKEHPTWKFSNTQQDNDGNYFVDVIKYDDADREFVGGVSKKPKFIKEGVYDDCSKEIEKLKQRKKDIKRRIEDLTSNIPNGENYKDWLSKEELDEYEDLDFELDNISVRIGDLEGQQAEIRYIDNGSADNYDGFESLKEAKDILKEKVDYEKGLDNSFFVYSTDKNKLKDFKKKHKELTYTSPIDYSFATNSFGMFIEFDDSAKKLGVNDEGGSFTVDSIERLLSEDKKDDKKSSKKDTKKKDKKEKEDEEDIDIEDEIDIDVKDDKDLPDVDVDDMLSLDDIDIDKDIDLDITDEEDVPEEIVDSAKATTISDVVKNEFDSIDAIKGIIATLSLSDDVTDEDSNVIDILNGAIDLKLELVGMLNKALGIYDEDAVTSMLDGQERAEDILAFSKDGEEEEITIDDEDDVFGGGQDLEITDKFDIDRDGKGEEEKGLFDLDDIGALPDEEIEDDSVIIKDKKNK